MRPKLLIAWNVWNNYEDLLLGSELARLLQKEEPLFETLHLMAQGGYDVPPDGGQRRYLDGYHHIQVPADYEPARIHPKLNGYYRVLAGVQNAYRVAEREGCDFALVTNADAWCLDHSKLRVLLDRQELHASAVSCRVGPVTSLWNSYGDYVPFFDDHFIILNVPLCRRYGVFEYDQAKAYRAHFLDYGGIHYGLHAWMDERVPSGLFHAYTDMRDCVNHYGEAMGFFLLPWQYQPSFAFLHANCAQEPFLHPLRAAQLRLGGFERFPEIGRYCARHPHREGISSDPVRGCAFFEKNLEERLRCGGAFLLKKLLHAYQRKFGERAWIERAERTLEPGRKGARHYYDLYAHVLPPTLASRRPRA